MENKAPKSTKPSTRSQVVRAKKPRVQRKAKSTSAIPSRYQEKKDNYHVTSKSSLLRDFKNTARSGFTSVKRQFNSFSSLILKKSKNSPEDYHQITNLPTPVKLYSPFTIESPLPLKSEDKMRVRQQLFHSPTNRLQEDLVGLEKGINQLNILSNKIDKCHPNSINKENIPRTNINFEPLLIQL